MKIIDIIKNVNWFTVYGVEQNNLILEKSSLNADTPKTIAWDDFLNNISNGPDHAFDHQVIYFTTDDVVFDGMHVITEKDILYKLENNPTQDDLDNIINIKKS